MHNFTVLNSDDIAKIIETLPDWKVVDNFLVSTFVFSSFRNAIAFINLVAIESEVLNHHPSLTNNYKKVEFKLSTHDAGNRVTDLDFKLAKYITKTAKQFL